MNFNYRLGYVLTGRHHVQLGRGDSVPFPTVYGAHKVRHSQRGGHGVWEQMPTFSKMVLRTSLNR